MHFKKTEYVWLHILAAISQELEAKAREKKEESVTKYTL